MALAALSCTPEEKKDIVYTESDVFFGAPKEQQSIYRINIMPSLPAPYEMLDWRQKTLDYDAYVFDWNRNDEVGPLIWLDESRKNVRQNTFGLYTVVGDIRQGKDVNQTAHEAINTMAAVLSGGLVGIDKTSQDGYNYLKMLQNYCGIVSEWEIMLNNTSSYAQDWWYNILPNILYYGVCDLFPNVEGAEDIMKSIADKFAAADEQMNGNYGYSWYNYRQLYGVQSHIPAQQDAAAGHAWVLLQAYRHFGDENYLKRALSATETLNNLRESRFYECILPYGILTAAYFNKTRGTSFDIAKMMGWVFDGSKGRSGWGVICGNWDGLDVYGLQGSITDGGGYAFQMNSYLMAWPLVPMVKYAPEWAAAIGKWMLNNANASRLFFPCNIDDAHQFAPELKNLTHNNIGYEGLRYSDRYGKYKVHPIAEGDGPSWINGMPVSSMFSLYSTSSIGVFGSIISKTDVDCILRLDCNVTDFFAERPYPTYLYYNPYKEQKEVTYEVQASGSVDLFDLVTRSFVANEVSGSCRIPVFSSSARVIVEVPAGTPINWLDDGSILCDNKYILAK